MTWRIKLVLETLEKLKYDSKVLTLVRRLIIIWINKEEHHSSVMKTHQHTSAGVTHGVM